MIYLLRTRYIDCTLLKIGYTGDNNFETRMYQYKLHNPRCEVLYNIYEGTEEDEKNLHFIFRRLVYPDYGKEWFYEDQSIYDFFNINKTKQDLDNNLPKQTKIIDQKKSEIQRIITKIINRWLCLISIDTKLLNTNYNNYNSYVNECRDEIGKSIKDKSDVLYYIATKYNIPSDIQFQIQDFIDGNIQNSPEINQVLDEFWNYKDFPNRMRLLCEIDMTDAERGILLDQLPLSYKNYYQTLGPKRLKAHGYNKTDIEREYSDMQFNTSDLEYELYNTFSVGSKYSRNLVKETLGRIYKSLGYNKSPKANDLEQYFEIKPCKVLVDSDTGKRDNGFEILGKKNTDLELSDDD